METIIAIATLFAIYVWPLFVGMDICKKRNRDKNKSLVITIFFGWIGVLGLYVLLKTRREDGALI